MRPSQKQNRARGRGNRRPNGNIVNRVFESAGPEGKVRGTPQQIIDKYQALARDAQTSGDRVMAENFLQHAEHYQRILLEAQGAREERREPRMHDQDGRDEDMREEGEGEGEEQFGAPFRDERPRDERPRYDDRPRGEEAPRRDARQGGDQRPPEVEVSGLTTIDARGDDGGSLLVEAEDLSASQPPRRRRNQRRDRGEAPSQAEADAQPE
jgi:hypothetical protein